MDITRLGWKKEQAFVILLLFLIWVTLKGWMNERRITMNKYLFHFKTIHLLYVWFKHIVVCWGGTRL